MKKIFLVASLLAISSVTYAQETGQPCTGGTAGVGVAVDADPSGDSFIIQGFTPRCSSNVNLHFAQTARAVGVGAVSSKGGNTYAGNTEGGAVAGTPCGTNKRCEGTESEAAAAAALAAASS